MAFTVTYDDLVSIAGKHNDGYIDTANFRETTREWLKLAPEAELALLAGAITWAWQQMNEPPQAEASSVQCPHCKWGFAPSVIEQHIREKHS